MKLKFIHPFIMAAAGLLVFAVSACGTVEGAGRDIQDSGHAISGAAAQTRDDMKN